MLLKNAHIAPFRYFVASILSLFLFGVPAALADTFEWTNAASGDFDVAGNWTNTTGVDPAPPDAGE